MNFTRRLCRKKQTAAHQEWCKDDRATEGKLKMMNRKELRKEYVRAK
nr:MAG TPA: hypothetical protein [Caudoviricetes sp.]